MRVNTKHHLNTLNAETRKGRKRIRALLGLENDVAVTALHVEKAQKLAKKRECAEAERIRAERIKTVTK